jgi:hypothetical protein
MMFRGPGLYASLTIALCGPALAHHSLQASFDTSQQIEIEGIVNEYIFINPHAVIVMNVATDDGGTERWVAEGGAVSVLQRKGWTGDEFTPGDRIRVKGNPAKNGSHLVSILSIGSADGRSLTTEGIPFAEIDELRRQSRNQRLR